MSPRASASSARAKPWKFCEERVASVIGDAFRNVEAFRAIGERESDFSAVELAVFRATALANLLLQSDRFLSMSSNQNALVNVIMV